MKFAYYDPPYIGRAKKYYGCEEIDHVELFRELEVYDGWALSGAEDTLKILLNLAPAGTKTAPWCKSGGNPAMLNPCIVPAWEPVLYVPVRRPDHPVKNYLVCPTHRQFADREIRKKGVRTGGTSNIRMSADIDQPHPGRRKGRHVSGQTVKASSKKMGNIGRKPEEFCFWLFELLGVHPLDEFVDRFPGSGAVTWAWKKWRRQKMNSLDSFVLSEGM